MTHNKAGTLTKNAALKLEILRLHDAGMLCKPIARMVGLSAPTVSGFLRSTGRALNRQPGKQIDIVDPQHARCSRCGRVQPLSDWPLYCDRGKLRRPSYCRACINKQQIAHANSTTLNKLKKKYVQLCARQRRNGKIFNVTLEQFVELWKIQRGRCFYTGIDLSIDVGGGKKPNSLSVDRVEPGQGYQIDNIVLAANRITAVYPGVAYSPECWPQPCISLVVTWSSASAIA